MAPRLKVNGNGQALVPFEAHNAHRYSGIMDPIAVAAFNRAMTHNFTSESRRWAQNLDDPRRSLEAECGLPELGQQIPIDLYQQLYDRDPIAARVVEVLAKQTWQVSPEIYEDENAERNTPFEQSFDDLGLELRGGDMNWYKNNEGHPLWQYLKRLDILSGIGSYGVMLLGFDDVDQNWKMSQPVKGLEEQGSIPGARKEMVQNFEKAVKDRTFQPYRVTCNAQYDGGGLKSKRIRLTHLRVFGEPLVQVTQFESNPTSFRFGQPVMYSVTMNDARDAHSSILQSASTFQVHWSRIHHYCDLDQQAGSSEVFAPPRMRPSLNILLGLRKIYLSDPEAYWRACFTILSWETHPQLGGDVDMDVAGMRDMMELFHNSSSRDLYSTGMALKSISPTLVDPTSHINIGIEGICIKIPCPIRIFKGSERGELASSQDDGQWNDSVAGRMNGTATPRNIVPLVNRLIAVGALEKPTVGKKKKTEFKMPTQAAPQAPPGPGVGPPGGGKPFGGTKNVASDRAGFSVFWPDLDSLTDNDKATIGNTKTTALAGYIAGGCDALVPPHDYLTKYQGFSDEEADAMLEEAAQVQEEKMEEQAAKAEELGMEVEPPDGLIDPEQQEREHELEMEKAKAGVKPLFGKPPTDNAFCPTGEGGGIDPSCSAGKEAMTEAKSERAASRAKLDAAKAAYEKALEEHREVHEATGEKYSEGKQALIDKHAEAKEKASEAFDKVDEFANEAIEAHDNSMFTAGADKEIAALGPDYVAYEGARQTVEDSIRELADQSYGTPPKDRLEMAKTARDSAVALQTAIAKLKPSGDFTEGMIKDAKDGAKKLVSATRSAYKQAQEYMRQRKVARAIKKLATNQFDEATLNVLFMDEDEL